MLKKENRKVCEDDEACSLARRDPKSRAFKPREAFNSYSHFIGAALSIAALFSLLAHIPRGSQPATYVSLAVFSLSMLLLYTTSGIYHLVSPSSPALQALRRLDHIMIYVLIAGTYTPLCMIFLHGAWRWGLLIAIWSFVLLGLVFKLAWITAPRWLSTLIYILMGWMVSLAFFPLLQSLSLAGMAWLLAGGLCYSIGAVFYAVQRPRFTWPGFGFHEIFHLFVLAGSISHWWMFFAFV